MEMAQEMDSKVAEELDVVVVQEPGTVRWNFDQLKGSLASMMATYEGMVYSEDTIQTAKRDLAALRRLRSSVEDRRKEIRKRCLEPYEAIEAQAKELTSLIDRPIDAIDGQVKAYEEERKRRRREEVMAYMAEAFSDLPEGISKRLQMATYDKSWENATATRKSWEGEIAAAHDRVRRELDTLSKVDEDFRDMAMEKYGEGLVLVDALDKVNELERQREALRQREQSRKEEAERKAAERHEAESQMPAASQPQAAAKAVEPDGPDAASGTVEALLRVRGTESQLARIRGFIEYAGATFEEVR